MSKIEFDFHKAKVQEERLEDMLLQLNQTIVERYDTCVGEIGQAWQGEEGKLFQYKMQLQREKMMHTANVLNQAKEALQEAEVKAYAAEEKAKEIAEERIYK